VKLVSLNIFFTLIGILILEIIFGNWFKNESLQKLGFIKDKEYKIDVSKLYTRNELINYTRDKYGLRGNSILNHPEKIDILTIGGSTTDQRYIDDKETWQSVLERELNENKLNYCVANAGIDGQSTVGHIYNFSLWFSNIDKLKPKYVFYFIGINDAFRFQESTSNDGQNSLLQGPGAEYFPKRIIPFHKSAFYNIYRIIKGNRESSLLKLRHQKNVNFNIMEYTQTPLLNPTFYENYKILINSYIKRVQKLDSLTKSIGAVPVFISQASNHYYLKDSIINGVNTIFENSDIKFNGVDAYNLLKIAHNSLKTYCGDSIIFINTFNYHYERSDFYDYVHMTPTGSKKLGKNIAYQFLLKKEKTILNK
jgi:lysophospholipase L1-like esterase